MRTLTTLILVSMLVIPGMAQSPSPQATAQPPEKTAAQDKVMSTGTRIKGRVTADGRPVAEASILVFPVNLAGNLETALTTLFSPMISDADGRFELTGLRAGAYTIAASSPGYVLSDQDAKALYRPGDTAALTLVKGGVITGRVTNSSGDPVVGALVRAIKVREADDKPPRSRGNVISQMSEQISEIMGPYKTDDRGIYRIFGLSSGIYEVAAGGRGAQGFSFGAATGYDGDAPTYYPSSTLETASDVTVAAGAEATNIDIRYRDNRGYSISGTVSTSDGKNPQGTSVLLTRAGNGIVEGTTTLLSARNGNRFILDSVLDGEYAVTAMGGAGNLMTGQETLSVSLSQSQRVTVRGMDVTGIDLRMEPLGSIEGRTVLEPLQDAKQKAECKDLRNTPLQGLVLSARDQRKPVALDPVALSMAEFKNTTPNDKGEFTIRLLRAGVQRLDIEIPGECLYLKAMSLPQTDPNAKPIDAAKNGITLKSGDRVKGLVVTLSEGAAVLRGRVVVGEDKLPAMKMRVHLVPAEPEAADEVLRYYEAEALNDGSFSVSNIAPGKYWLIAREIADQEQSETDRRPVAWDAGARVGLRFEGEGSKKVIELSRCQHVADFVLTYTPLTKPAKPPAKKPGQD